MIFIRKIPLATSKQWGICNECAKKSATSTLCPTCLDRRSAYFHSQVTERNNSWEYRIRSWFSKVFDPTKSKRF